MVTDEQKLIDEYIAECRRVNGDGYADNMRVVYSSRGGWFRIRSPFRLGPDEYIPGLSEGRKNVRRAEFVKVIETLKRRPDANKIEEVKGW